MNKVNCLHSQTRQLQNSNKQHPRTFCDTHVSMLRLQQEDDLPRPFYQSFCQIRQTAVISSPSETLNLIQQKRDRRRRRAAAYKTNTITRAPYLFCVGRLQGAPPVCGEKPCHCCGNAGEPDNASCSYGSLSGSPGNRSMWLDARLRDCG